jgi:hypothetical protein
MDCVVFRAKNGAVRAVQVERGKGVPVEHQMRPEEETFAVVIDDVVSPEQAIWRAALECYGEMIGGLVDVLGLYLDEIGHDRDRPIDPEQIDSIFMALERYRAEGIRDAEDIGKDLAAQWPAPESPPEAECPGQLKLLP